MQKLLEHIIDFIFPPNPQELRIRELTVDWLHKNGPRSSSTEFPFIQSLFSYKDPLVRELIWQIKYKKNSHALYCAAYALYKHLEDSDALLIPVPISKKRRKERGYNQCELLIDAVLKLDKPHRLSKNFNLIVRSKHIDKQTFKNRNERLTDTKNIFSIIGSTDKSQNIVIIDDVSTTGSTINEIRDVFIKDGYKNVSGLTVAH